MTTTPVQNERVRNVFASARTEQVARVAYEKAWMQYFAHEIQPLPEDRFWELWAYFISLVPSSKPVRHFRDWPKSAAHEFFRSTFDRNRENYTVDEAIRFARTWRVIGRSVERDSNLYDIFEGSDDRISDFLDSIPLAGREVLEKVRDGDFGNMRAVWDYVKENAPEHVVDSVGGEHFLAMKLEEKAKKWFRLESRSDDAEFDASAESQAREQVLSSSVRELAEIAISLARGTAALTGSELSPEFAEKIERLSAV